MPVRADSVGAASDSAGGRDVDAFNAHASGPHFAAFFAEASTYAQGPTWLMKGNLIGDEAVA
ncbi:hypothetical protein [Streptomyces sp. NPDC059757]|uniref:hypothetical protein n=1 Tax=unclassified Streptomyces TaxID=2593676 RepID=UPI0036476F07